MTRRRGKDRQECLHEIYLSAYTRSMSCIVHTGRGGPCQEGRGGDVGEVCGQQGVTKIICFLSHFLLI